MFSLTMYVSYLFTCESKNTWTFYGNYWNPLTETSNSSQYLLEFYSPSNSHKTINYENCTFKKYVVNSQTIINNMFTNVL